MVTVILVHAKTVLGVKEPNVYFLGAGEMYLASVSFLFDIYGEKLRKLVDKKGKKK